MAMNIVIFEENSILNPNFFLLAVLKLMFYEQIFKRTSLELKIDICRHGVLLKLILF